MPNSSKSKKKNPRGHFNSANKPVISHLFNWCKKWNVKRPIYGYSCAITIRPVQAIEMRWFLHTWLPWNLHRQSRYRPIKTWNVTFRQTGHNNHYVPSLLSKGNCIVRKHSLISASPLIYSRLWYPLFFNRWQQISPATCSKYNRVLYHTKHQLNKLTFLRRNC